MIAASHGLLATARRYDLFMPCEQDVLKNKGRGKR